jgi:hypothetical protein
MLQLQFFFLKEDQLIVIFHVDGLMWTSWLHDKKNHDHTDDPEEIMGFDCWRLNT